MDSLSRSFFSEFYSSLDPLRAELLQHVFPIHLFLAYNVTIFLLFSKIRSANSAQDYTGETVTKENFMNVLLGKADAIDCNGKTCNGKVLKSTENDEVRITSAILLLPI